MPQQEIKEKPIPWWVWIIVIILVLLVFFGSGILLFAILNRKSGRSIPQYDPTFGDIN